MAKAVKPAKKAVPATLTVNKLIRSKGKNLKGMTKRMTNKPGMRY